MLRFGRIECRQTRIVRLVGMQPEKYRWLDSVNLRRAYEFEPTLNGEGQSGFAKDTGVCARVEIHRGDGAR